MSTTSNIQSSSPKSEIPGLEDDEIGTRVVREELKLLSTVQSALTAAAAASLNAVRSRANDDARLLELRDEVAVAKPDDLPSLFEQMHQVGSLLAQRGKGALGAIDLRSPYFGHLRLDESGKRRDVLVGSRSYVDSNAGVRIVDWRHAPVSRIFYRYGQGDDYEEQLGGRTVEGVVTARRSVAIVDGALVRVASPEGTFIRGTDGVWKRIEAFSSRLVGERKWSAAKGEAPRLGISADGTMRQDKHLPAIASMLDKTQFDLIAKPGAGLVILQGSAGSGKTTVGLHRVAYLAFADPQRFRADRLLVVVPHEALLHYVGHVLPSLGVDGAAISTFPRIAARLMPLNFPKLPTHLNEETPPVVTRIKSHPAILTAVHDAAKRLHDTTDAKVVKAMEKWPDGSVVVAAWKSLTGTPDQRVSAFGKWLKNNASLPDVTRSAVEKLGHDLRHDTRAVLGLWDELLTSREALGEAFAKEPKVTPAQLDRVHEWCLRQARIRQDGERDGDTPSIDSEDIPIILRLWQVIRGPLVAPDGTPIRFSHVFIDEVQDASSIELRVLLDLAADGGSGAKLGSRSITLAGDIAQRMLDEGDDRGEFDWHKLLRDLELDSATTVEPLKVSYRSTAEITQFARGVLGPYAHEAEPVATRHGPPVELFSFASPGEGVAFVADALKQLALDEPHANVALVARFPQQADVYFEGLARAEVPRVRRVARQDFTWEPGFDVTDVRQTKGLEFDEVVLLETTASSYPDTAAARHAMYVGATRAAHQLWCITSEKPSAIVTAALTLR